MSTLSAVLRCDVPGFPPLISFGPDCREVVMGRSRNADYRVNHPQVRAFRTPSSACGRPPAQSRAAHAHAQAACVTAPVPPAALWACRSRACSAPSPFVRASSC